MELSSETCVNRDKKFNFQTQSSPTRHSQPRKRRFPWVFFIIVILISWVIWDSLNPTLPKSNEPPKLYSNQCQQDIQATLLKAIQSAKSSIYLVMFGLSDQAVLSTLSKKIDQNIPTKIFYDATGSPNVYSLLAKSEITPVKNRGLMHQKIVVLNDEMVFIGSANMTRSSLRMHDNLMIGFVSSDVAKFLKEHEPFTPGYKNFLIGGQEIELWLLPDLQNHALTELRKKIRTASKSIRIALFTFTHPDLVDEVIKAHKRGVDVSVVVDKYSGYGASAKSIERLKEAHVPISLSQGIELLHHKFMYIDEEVLLTGSANWTKSAFNRNSDCIIALNQLNIDQKKFMNRLWRNIRTSSR